MRKASLTSVFLGTLLFSASALGGTLVWSDEFDGPSILALNWLHNNCGSANDNCDGADYQPDGRVDFEDLYYLSLFWLD